MKLLPIILSLFFSNLLFSQAGSVEGQDINLPVITSPSPDVYSLQEYGEIPVSYYTGIPQISIPLYEITTRAGLSVPINLDYHAGGIRVDEVASVVGLGWSLKTGGHMNIKTNGTPDFNGGNNFPDTSISADIQPNGGYVHPLYNNGDPIYQYMRDIYDGTSSCQPDTYKFSVPSGEGEFYLDSNGDAHLIPAANYKVDYSALEITDGNGTITKFGFGDNTSKDPSGCKYTSIDDPLNSRTRSYKIDSISTYLNENIDYSYRPISYAYVASKIETDFEIVQYSTTGCNVISDTYCDNLINVTQKLVTRIDFPGGYAEFNYSDQSGLAINGNDNRLDLPGGVALREIIIKNSSGAIISEYKFNYDYFKVIGDNTSDYYRLKLLNVIKNGEETHSFEYYEDQNLPKRLSFEQDYWGFYNGQSGNSTLIPEMVYDGQTLSGANREIGSLAYTRANSLKKITYPTKGSSRFNYSQNDYYAYNYPSKEIISEGFSLAAHEISGISGSKAVSQSQDGEITDFKISITNECENNSDPEGLGNTYCLVNLRDSNGALYASYTATGEYVIDPGGYNFSQITLEMEVEGCNCIAEVSWNRSITTHSAQNVKAAGLRISQIINTPNTGNSVTKNYSYIVPGTTQSSGKFHDYPQFYSSLKTPGKPDSEGYANTSSTCLYMIRQNSPFYSLNNASGQSVGYAYVQESINGNGEKRFKFTTYNDLALSYSIPVSPVTSYAYKRGMLLDKEIYNENGNILQKTSNTYEFDDQFASLSREFQGGDKLSIGISVSFDELIEMAPGIYAPKLKYNINYFPTSWIKKVASSDWLYTDNGVIQTQSTKEFSNVTNLMPTINVLENGTNLRETSIKYPDDVDYTNSLGYESLTSSELNDIKRLGTLHRNTLPVQVEIKEKDKSSGATLSTLVKRNIYEDFNGFVQLAEVKSLKEGFALESRINYHRYDASGNPVDVSKTEGSHVIYLWGYNDQFPIAKIENATYSAVASALGKTVSTLDTTIDESDMAAINLLRSNANLSQSLITTYTYDPLIGITNMRDSRGFDTQYTYDNFGRLQSIKDDAGNLIKDFKYHYQQ